MTYRTGYAFFPLLAAAVLTVACDNGSSPALFEHDVADEIAPWTDTDFDVSEGKFTFAIFSDLTGGERDGIFEIAIAQLALLRPEFIINVGDLIEGSTGELAEAERQWDSFDDRTAKATTRVFYVGGNHDLTGEFLQSVWDARYGRRYYHFVYRNTLFLVLDTEDHTAERMQQILEARNHAIQVAGTEGWDAFAKTEYANMPENAAGNISAEQSLYFRDVIAANADVRWTFLLMHKSPWLREDLTTFADIENALGDRPYTLFNGHVHAYQHLERRGRDYIRLATTGGVQLPANGRSMDHVTLVTVGTTGVDIVNLLLEGILDRTGHVPLDGDDRCFELASCGGAP